MSRSKDRNVSRALNDDWKTPEYIMVEVRKILGNTFLDPCPLKNDLSAFNGLDIDWGSKAFVNPPYGRKDKESFIKKAVEQYKKGCHVLMLIPVCTSSAIFHDYILKYGKITFIRKRIKFIGINSFGELVTKIHGMHDSMFVEFKK